MIVREPCSRVSSERSGATQAPAVGVLDFYNRDRDPNDFLAYRMVVDILRELLCVPLSIMNKFTNFSIWIQVSLIVQIQHFVYILIFYPIITLEEDVVTIPHTP